MAISDEEIRLILNTQDSSTQVHQLATQVEFLGVRMEILSKDFNEGRLAEAQYVSSSQMVSDMLRDRSALLEDVARNTGILEKSHRDIGQTMLQTSYAVQDFTSQIGTRGLSGALAAVQNNIPGILMGLGAGGGLAGVISMASVALAAILPHITGLGDETEKAGKKAEEGAKRLTGWNDQLERLVKAGEKLREAQTKPEEDTQKAVTEAIKFAGARTISAGYERHLQEQDAAMEQAEFLRRMDSPAIQRESQYGGPALQASLEKRVREEIRGEARDTRRTRVDAFMGSLPDSAANRASLVEMARARPNLFGRDTAQLLEEAEPEARRAGDRELEDAEAFGARAHAGVANRQMNRAVTEERRKRWESRQKKEDASIAQAADEEDARTKEDEDDVARAMRKNQQDSDAKARKHAAEAKQAAREADPTNVMARNAAMERDDVAREVQRRWDAGGRMEPLGKLQGIVNEAVGQLEFTGNDVAWAVQRAIEAVENRRNRQLQQMSETRMP